MSHLIDTILSWASSNPRFDTTFVKSVLHHYNRRGRITLKQQQALENIVVRWRVTVPSSSSEDDEDTDEDQDEVVVCTAIDAPMRCPLTGAFFVDPVKHRSCGHVYERAAVKAHIQICGPTALCPVAGCPRQVSEKDLAPICTGDVREAICDQHEVIEII